MIEHQPARTDEQWIQDRTWPELIDAWGALDRLSDDALGRELERALEIRAAVEPGQASETAASHREPLKARWHRPRWMLPLAAAASVVLVLFGGYWLRPPVPPDPVFRGAEQHMALRIEVEASALRARWNPVPGAAGYELRVFARDGGMLQGVVTEDREAAIDLRPAASGHGAQAASVDVVALDELGQTLLRSQRIDLPDPNAEHE